MYDIIPNDAVVIRERLYLDGEQRVVKKDDPTRQTLLFAEGMVISRSEAERYGIVPTTASAATGDPSESKKKAEKP